MLTFHLFHLTSFPSRLIVASPRHQSSTKQAVHGCRKRAATCHEPTCSRAMEPSDGASPCHYLWQLHHHGARGGVSGWVRRVLSGGAAFFLFAWRALQLQGCNLLYWEQSAGTGGCCDECGADTSLPPTALCHGAEPCTRHPVLCQGSRDKWGARTSCFPTQISLWWQTQLVHAMRTNPHCGPIVPSAQCCTLPSLHSLKLPPPLLLHAPWATRNVAALSARYGFPIQTHCVRNASAALAKLSGQMPGSGSALCMSWGSSPLPCPVVSEDLLVVSWGSGPPCPCLLLWTSGRWLPRVFRNS